MYYEADTIDDIFKCAFCLAKFTGLVKLLPECGNSICGECYDALVDGLQESRKFVCQSCNEVHVMPENGLFSNKVIMKMLQAKPKEKPLSASAKTLRILINEVQEKIDTLQSKSKDEPGQINEYCDSLELEVKISIESAIKHLGRVQDGMLNEISKYRNRLLESTRPSTNSALATDATSRSQAMMNVKKELELLVAKFDGFSQNWRDYFSVMSKQAGEDEIGSAQAQAKELSLKADMVRSKLSIQLFQGQYLKFKENEAFFSSKSLIGSLAFEPWADKANITGEINAR